MKDREPLRQLIKSGEKCGSKKKRERRKRARHSSDKNTILWAENRSILKQGRMYHQNRRISPPSKKIQRKRKKQPGKKTRKSRGDSCRPKNWKRGKKK